MEIVTFLNEHELTKIVIAGIIAWMSVFIINVIIHNFFQRTHFLEERKEQTIESMTRSLTKYTAVISFIFFTISQFVENFGHILAGAGIVGVIVGFRAQSLIKDVLAGIFLTYEKQLHKGDFVTVNNTFNGTVEDLGLRFLKVREWSGKLLTISNGEVKQIHNYNIDQMRVIERVTVSFRENPEKIFATLEMACERLNTESYQYLKKDIFNNIIEPFQVYGMTSLNAGYRGYEYTVTGLVEDTQYWDAAKEARKIIAQMMFENKIRMAEETTLLQRSTVMEYQE